MLKALKIHAKLKELRGQLSEFERLNADFAKRAEDAEKALSEAESPEEIELVENTIDELEKEKSESDIDAKIEGVKHEIEEAEKELEELENKPETPPQESEREVKKEMNIRTKEILSENQRSAMINDSAVQEFVPKLREMITSQTRGVTNSDLTIPTVMLSILREITPKYSKLMDKVNRISVRGESRRVIAGTIPEAVWTEMGSAINELALDFSEIVADGYKVSGFFAVDNYIIEDNDVELLSLLLDYLAQAIGKAIDKAIIYGKGVGMPLGIVTRLAQESKPSDWSSKTNWTDLHTSNIKTLNLSATTGAAFFRGLMEALGVPDPKYNGVNASMFWCMNRKTHMDIVAKSIEFNSAAALVASAQNTMPIIGGEIVELEFMADNDICGGFGSVYDLIDRAGGTTIRRSEEARFLQDQTVIKGTARYDGKPVYAEGFVLLNYANTTPTTSVTFAADSVNGDKVALSALKVGTATLFPQAFNKDVLNYHCTVDAHSQKIEATALAGSAATIVIKNGDSVVTNGGNATFTSGDNTLTFTVTNGNETARVYTVIVTDTHA